MRCLCCNEEIKEEASAYEKECKWHKKCIKSFFSTPILPELVLSNEALNNIANENIKEGFTVTGVQKKLSMHLSKKNEPRLTIVNYPNGYILKPQSDDFQNLPELEYLAMYLAKISGIKTVPFALMEMNGTYAYITKRVDRLVNKDHADKLAMEDFCQLDLRLTIDKYKGSYERCSKIITKYSSRSAFDLTEFFLRLIFSFAIGNSDMHLKNFSLIQKNIDSSEYVLSPAYDMLPVSVVMPEDKDEFALTMNGKNTHLRKKDFIIFGERIGLSEKVTRNLMERISNKKDEYITIIQSYQLNEYLKEKLVNLLIDRLSVFK